MNCQNFNEIINEIADYRPMDANARAAARAHAALCAACAASLVNAQLMSKTLLVAAGAEREQAPAHIKQGLLVAFATQQQRSQPAGVVEISSRRRAVWWIATAAAVAAAILVAATLPALKAGFAPSQSPPAVAKSSSNRDVAPPTVPASTPNLPHPAATPGPSATIRRAKQHQVNKRTRSTAGQNTFEAAAQNKSNQYLPLTYLASATAFDSGTVVRVRLSRSALLSLGLPVSGENSNGSVMAEVVMGDDGLARAIRLVE